MVYLKCVYILCIDKLLKEIERRSKDLWNMKFTESFITNWLEESDTSERAELIAPLFKGNVGELDIDIVAYLLEARTVRPAEVATVRERLCKHSHY
jgi:hypothetical protein